MHILKAVNKELNVVAGESFVFNQKIVYTNNVKEIINFTKDHVVNVLIYYWISLSV